MWVKFCMWYEEGVQFPFFAGGTSATPEPCVKRTTLFLNCLPKMSFPKISCPYTDSLYLDFQFCPYVYLHASAMLS